MPLGLGGGGIFLIVLWFLECGLGCFFPFYTQEPFSKLAQHNTIDTGRHELDENMGWLSCGKIPVRIFL